MDDYELLLEKHERDNGFPTHRCNSDHTHGVCSRAGRFGFISKSFPSHHARLPVRSAHLSSGRRADALLIGI